MNDITQLEEELSQAERCTAAMRKQHREAVAAEDAARELSHATFEEVTATSARRRHSAVSPEYAQEFANAILSHEAAEEALLKAKGIVRELDRLVTLLLSAESKLRSRLLQARIEANGGPTGSSEPRPPAESDVSDDEKPPPWPQWTRRTSFPTTAANPIEAWRKLVDIALSDYTALHVFPAPPARPCMKNECPSKTQQGRTLTVCDCVFKEAFSGLSKQELKMERVRWHPDKFARCPEQHRELFQKMAQEIFVVVDNMYQKAK